jgi:hypothetical protein
MRGTCCHTNEGPNWQPEGEGSEWEPTKILLDGDYFSNKMYSIGYPKSHAPHTTFNFPKSHIHWSATSPRNKHYLQAQLLHMHASGNNSGAICLEGAVKPGMGAVSVGVLDRQPMKRSTWDRWMWPHRDRQLKGETRGTQFRQVRAVRCIIPYVMYAA